MNNKWKQHRIERMEKWLTQVDSDRYVEHTPLKLSCVTTESFRKVEQVSNMDFRPISEGEAWGRDNQIVWFKIEGTVPADWTHPASLLMNMDGEILLHDESGSPIYALSSGSIFDKNFVKDLFLLPSSMVADTDFTYYGEAVATALFGLLAPTGADSPSARKSPPTGPQPILVSHVLEAQLVSIDPALTQLFRQGFILLDQLKDLPEKHMRKSKLDYHLFQAVDCYEIGDLSGAQKIIQGCLADPAYTTELTYTAIGHAHIDTAWLWRLEESTRKCARTFSSQLEHIRRYPDYVFGASSPHHYAWMEEYYPTIFEGIREQVAAERWECLGAMWVEADCNLSGGEALARQLIYGKRYFREKFGVDVNHLWLPDVFGYTAALPQLLQQVGAPYFMTSKISWNYYNTFPFASFHWEGIDGTRVLTHLPPTNAYNEELIPSRLAGGRDTYPEKGIVPKALAVYGIGDGGGGPNEVFIESGQLLENLEAAPKVKFGTADGFFKELEEYADELPVWSDELYLELHRGTLTTQAKLKKGNRKLEHRLRDTEILYAAFKRDQYPQDEIETLWKKFLVHQFHDILPGSCITEVVEDSLREYDEVNEALDALWAPWSDSANPSSWSVVNSLNFNRDDLVCLPGASDVCIEADGQILPTQRVGDETWVRYDQAGLSSAVLKTSKTACPASEKRSLTATDFPLTIENDLVLYRINAHAEVIFGQDKATGRIFIEDQKANELVLYADKPSHWEAWDIDPFYPNCQLESAISAGTMDYEIGRVAQVLTVQMSIGKSTIFQQISLPNHRATLEFDHRVEWNEKRRLLRLNVPTTLRASSASYHIQFGMIQRKTSDNTSQEQAQFEVAAHEFADLSEGNFGMALINDCKYGYKVKGKTLSMSLLRASNYPDKTADIGEHTFRYALHPHAHSVSNSLVVETAAAFNQPRWTLSGDTEFKFPFQLDGEGIRLEVVKKAEDTGDLIVRFYEAKGRRSEAILTLDTEWDVEEVNLLEEPQKNLGRAKTLTMELGPFEIKTLRLQR